MCVLVGETRERKREMVWYCQLNNPPTQHLVRSHKPSVCFPNIASWFPFVSFRVFIFCLWSDSIRLVSLTENNSSCQFRPQLLFLRPFWCSQVGLNLAANKRKKNNNNCLLVDECQEEIKALKRHWGCFCSGLSPSWPKTSNSWLFFDLLTRLSYKKNLLSEVCHKWICL